MAPGDAASGIEAFVHAARGVVEQEALAHADDRWWVLEPLLVVERRGTVRTTQLRDSAAAVRALRSALGPLALPEALGVRRAAVALHVDLAVGDDVGAAVVLLAVTPLLQVVQSAAVERSDLGTPRLGPWRPGEVDADEVAQALRRFAGAP
jgi:hypothetical protein